MREFSVYAHLSEIDTEIGEIVGPQTRIGAMGHTGTVDDHLHFEVRTELNVVQSGDQILLPTDAESYWANTEAEFRTKWIDIGSASWIDYDSEFPWDK